MRLFHFRNSLKKLGWFFFFFLCSAVSLCSYASPELEKPLFRIFDEQKRRGFIDATGQIVIPPQFEEVRPFSEGVAAAKSKEIWGYIDKTGKWVIPPQYDTSREFSEGFAAVYFRNDKSCGYIDKAGRMTIGPFLAYRCHSFRDGLALLSFPSRDSLEYAFVDKTGKILFSHFARAIDFSEGLALVSGNGKNFRYIDQTGRTRIHLRKYKPVNPENDPFEPTSSFFDGLALVDAGYIDKSGKLVIRLSEGVQGAPFSEGIALLRKLEFNQKGEKTYPDSYGYIDRTGKLVIPFQFEEGSSFKDGFAVVKEVRWWREFVPTGYRGEYFKRWVAINPKGEVLFQDPPWGAFRFPNGLAYITLKPPLSKQPEEKGIYGYMDKTGRFVWLSPSGKEFLQQNGEKALRNSELRDPNN